MPGRVEALAQAVVINSVKHAGEIDFSHWFGSLEGAGHGGFARPVGNFISVIHGHEPVFRPLLSKNLSVIHGNIPVYKIQIGC